MSKNMLVVADSQWAGVIPDWLLEEIKSDRMILGLASLANRQAPKVGDAEIVAYLMTASLRAPLSREYTEIYIYLAAKLAQKRAKPLEGFMKEKLEQGLTDWEEALLGDLKGDIYRLRGGEIDHPLLNAVRDFKKRCDREAAREKNSRQPRIL